MTAPKIVLFTLTQNSDCNPIIVRFRRRRGLKIKDMYQTAALENVATKKIANTRAFKISLALIPKLDRISMFFGQSF